MTNVQSIPSPSIHSEDRAHEADHPTSQVAQFGDNFLLSGDPGTATAPNPYYYGNNYYPYSPTGVLPIRDYVFSLSAKI